MGRADCFILTVNAFTDEDTDEFFKPRKNPTKREYKFYITYVGTPRETVDWTPFINNVKN